MTLITCGSCARKNVVGSRFCQYCGVSLLRSQSTEKISTTVITPQFRFRSAPTQAPSTQAPSTQAPSAQDLSIDSSGGLEDINSPLPTGIRLRDNRYVIQQQLGQGGFGRTYQAEDTGRFNEIVVLKELTPSVQGTYALKKAEELFQREASTLHQLAHPQIPRFGEIFTARKRLFLVQDFVPGATYQKLLADRQAQGHTFSEAEVTQLLQDLLPVLTYLHSQGVIHRDISPDNIIRRTHDGLPILIDMGGVKQVALDVATEVANPGQAGNVSIEGTRLGKLGYAPDEQIRLGVVAPHSDLYALGVMALVLVSGDPPQQLQIPRPLESKWQQKFGLSSKFVEIIQKMIAQRPVDRYQSSEELLLALNASIEPPPTQIMLPLSTTEPAAVPSPQPVIDPSLASTTPAAPSSTQSASGEDAPKGNFKVWTILGGLSVVILGAYFGFRGIQNRIDSASTPATSLPATSAPSPSPPVNPSPKNQRRYKPVEIDKLSTYTHKTEAFSLLVPENWRSKDNSKPGEVIVLWTDPTRNGGLVADVFDVDKNPTQDELTILLQDFLKTTFDKEAEFFLKQPQPQKDGSVLLVWGYTAKAKGDIEVKLLGNSFVERQGKRVAILSFMVPDEQFTELEKPLNRIINNYNINPTAEIP